MKKKHCIFASRRVVFRRICITMFVVVSICLLVLLVKNLETKVLLTCAIVAFSILGYIDEGRRYRRLCQIVTFSRDEIKSLFVSIKWCDIKYASTCDMIYGSTRRLLSRKTIRYICVSTKKEKCSLTDSSKDSIFLELTPRNIDLLVKYSGGRSEVLNNFIASVLPYDFNPPKPSVFDASR